MAGLKKIIIQTGGKKVLFVSIKIADFPFWQRDVAVLNAEFSLLDDEFGSHLPLAGSNKHFEASFLKDCSLFAKVLLAVK